jgi:hypothetical protein
MKNSLFYQTIFGAEIGDIMMSLIQTTVLNDENPFEYLVALQDYGRDVVAEPERWLPWHWRETLAAKTAVTGQKPTVLATADSCR